MADALIDLISAAPIVTADNALSGATLAAPRDMPTTWTVGRNLNPREAGEGEYEVRITFAKPEISKRWAQWLLSLDSIGETP